MSDAQKCAQDSSDALCEDLNREFEHMHKRMTIHWVDTHGRHENEAHKQSLVIYLQGIAYHIQDIFEAIAVTDELHDEQMIERLLEMILTSCATGYERGVKKGTEITDKLDKALELILSSHKTKGL